MSVLHEAGGVHFLALFLLIAAESIGKRHAQVLITREFHAQVLPFEVDAGVDDARSEEVFTEEAQRGLLLQEQPAKGKIHAAGAREVVCGLDGFRPDVAVDSQHEVWSSREGDDIFELRHAVSHAAIERNVVEGVGPLVLPHARERQARRQPLSKRERQGGLYAGLVLVIEVEGGVDTASARNSRHRGSSKPQTGICS